jgi:hypothetical protein
MTPVRQEENVAPISRQGLLFIGEPIHRGQLFHPKLSETVWPNPRHLLQFGFGG